MNEVERDQSGGGVQSKQEEYVTWGKSRPNLRTVQLMDREEEVEEASVLKTIKVVEKIS